MTLCPICGDTDDEHTAELLAEHLERYRRISAAAALDLNDAG